MALNAWNRDFGTWQGRIQPSGFVPAEGEYVFVLGSDVEGLFQQLDIGDYVEIEQTAAFGREFTADDGTDTITLTAHGIAEGTALFVKNSGGALPGGLSASTRYYVINATANTFQLSAILGGSAIDITSAGTGTHYVSQNIVRFSGALRPPESLPSGVGWKASLRIDGSEKSSRLLEIGRERNIFDMSANVSKLVGDHDLAFRLEVVSV